MDDEAKLTLHGLVQHYIMLNEDEKNRKLNDLLDALDFNQASTSPLPPPWPHQASTPPLPPSPGLMMCCSDLSSHLRGVEAAHAKGLEHVSEAGMGLQIVIFVKSVARAKELNKLLVECNFPSICIHRGMKQEER